MTVVIAVVNLKGGSAKTTTAAFLAQAFHDAGLSVLVVDADPQGSLLRWADGAEWPMPTIALPARTLHMQLRGLAGEHDVVIVDTPPLDSQAGIVSSALRAADLVVVPVAPTPMEVERLSAVRDAIDDVAALRPDGCPPSAVAVLSRTVARAASTAVWRAALVDDGWRVLGAEVRRLESIAQAAGDPIQQTGPYAAVASEVLDITLTIEGASAA